MAVLLILSLTTTPTFEARMRRASSGRAVVCFSGMTSHPHRFALGPARFEVRAAVARLRPEAAAGFAVSLLFAVAFRRGAPAGAGAAAAAVSAATPFEAAAPALPGRTIGPVISLSTVFTRARSLRSSRILDGFSAWLAATWNLRRKI